MSATKTVLGGALIVIVAVAVISNLTSNDSSPITYDTCQEAHREAGEWQQRSVGAELGLKSTDPDANIDHQERVLAKALTMQDRIIVGNPNCFPADILMIAMRSLDLTLADLPEGPAPQ